MRFTSQLEVFDLLEQERITRVMTIDNTQFIHEFT